MRTIKFRGLQVDGKRWVYGPLVNLFGKVWIADTEREADAKSLAESLSGIYTNLVSNLLIQVKPETVGQFLSSATEDGSDVYQGDKVNYHYFYSCEGECENEVTGEVVWLEEDEWSGGPVACFALKFDKLSDFKEVTGEYDLEETDMSPIPFCQMNRHELSFTVTGNIHEN